MASDRIQKLYDAMSSAYNMPGPVEEFREKLNDSDVRRKVYDAMSSKFNMEEPFETFEKMVTDDLASYAQPQPPATQPAAQQPTAEEERIDTIAKSLLNNGAQRYVPANAQEGAAVASRVQQLKSEIEKQKEEERRRDKSFLEKSREEGKIQQLEDAQKAAAEAKKNARFEILSGITWGNPGAPLTAMTPKETAVKQAAVDKAVESVSEFRENKMVSDIINETMDYVRAVEKDVGLGQGFIDAATRLSTWDFGASDILNNLTLSELINKSESGEELTDQEEKTLDLIALATYITSHIQDSIGTGYNVGASLPQSLGFMASIALSPASGMGRAIEKWAFKKWGKQGIKNAARVAGDALEAGITTLTTGGGRVVADAIDRMNGQTTYGQTPDGYIIYGGQQDRETVGKAWAKAFGSNFIENWTEAFGEYLPGIGKAMHLDKATDWMGATLRGVTDKGLRKLHLNRMADFINELPATTWYETVENLKKAAKFNSVLGEIMEEEAGMAIEPLLIGDTTLKENFGIWSKDPKTAAKAREAQLTTALSCALMSGAFTATEIGGARVAAKFDNELKHANNEGTRQFGFKQWQSIKEQFDDASPEEAVTLLKDMVYGDNLKPEQRRAMVDYVYKLTRNQEYKMMDSKARGELSETARELRDAYDAGFRMATTGRPASFRGVQEDYILSQKLVEQYEQRKGLPLAGTIDYLKEADAATREETLNGMSEEAAQIARFALGASERFKGLYDGVEDAAAAEVMSFEDQIKPAVVEGPNGEQTVTTAKTADGRDVFIVSNDGTSATIIYDADGQTKEFYPTDQLTDIQTTELGRMVEDYTKIVQEEKRAQLEHYTKHNEKTEEPQVGMVIGDGDETVIVTEVGDGWATIQEAMTDQEGNVIPKPDGKSRDVTKDYLLSLQDEIYDNRDRMDGKTVPSSFQPNNIVVGPVDDATQQQAAANEQEVRSRIDGWSRRTGINVRILNDISEVQDEQAKAALEQGRTLTGWYNTASQEVEFYLPNILSSESPQAETDATFLHEVVAHRGLRDIPGEDFDQLMVRVWRDLMTDEDRRKYLAYNRHLKFENEQQAQRAAADEFVAHMAESLDVDQEGNASLWQRFVQWIKDILEKNGIAQELSFDELATRLYSALHNYEENAKSAEREGEQKAEPTALEQIEPILDKEGNATDYNWTAVPVETAIAGMKEAGFDDDVILDYAKDAVSQLQTDAKKMANPKGMTMAQRQQLKSDLKENTRRQEFWQNVINQVTAAEQTEQQAEQPQAPGDITPEPAEAPKPAPARKKIKRVKNQSDFQKMRKAMDDVIDEMDFDTQVKFALSNYGHSIAWENSTNGATRGLGAHLGVGPSTDSEEYRRYIQWRKLHKNGGKFPEEIAHAIFADLPEAIKEGHDEMEVANIVIDTLRSHNTPSGLVKDIYADIIASQEEAEREESERQQAAYAKDRGFASYEEYLIFESGEDIVLITDEEQKQLDNILYGEATDGSPVSGVQGVVQPTAGQESADSGSNEMGQREGSDLSVNGSRTGDTEEGSNDVLPGAEGEQVIQGLEGYSLQEIKKVIADYITDFTDWPDDFRITGIRVIGSRTNGTADENSDLDVLLQYEGDISEDMLFNMLNEGNAFNEPLEIDGIRVDFNPIRPDKSGTIDEWLERNKDYNKEEDKAQAALDILEGEEADKARDFIKETGRGWRDKPLSTLAEVRWFMDWIGYNGVLSKLMTSDNGKKFVKYQANGSVSPNIYLDETTPRDIFKQFLLYGNIMNVGIPTDIQEEFEREQAKAKKTNDALWADDREQIKKILTNAGIPFTDVIDSERGSRIVFTNRKNENGNYLDYMDVSDAEQALEDIEHIRVQAGKYNPDGPTLFRENTQETKEIYDIILSGDFNDVNLQRIDKYIQDVTEQQDNRKLSKRLPEEALRELYGRAGAGQIDALFSRVCESSVSPSIRASHDGRLSIEKRKKSLLEAWAKATGNWHTDLSDFTKEVEPLDYGKDSDVYLSDDGHDVFKLSKGKPSGKRFRPDIDNIALYNLVFPETAYEIVGYGDFGKGFVRILKQPFVPFNENAKVSVDERTKFMEDLGFIPLNKEKTAFSNGNIIASDIQKKNIVRSAQGEIYVIDADLKLHTKDMGGKYSYPPVEEDAKSPGSSYFREANERASLMGAHNISEDKLRKVFKQGGLANPSMAIVDTDKYIHQGYGEISLIPYTSTLDASRKAGVVTYSGDAYSPSYPSIFHKLTDKGEKKIDEMAARLANGNKILEDYFSSRMYDYAGGNSTRLAAVYLADKGYTPSVIMERGAYSHEDYERVKDIIERGRTGSYTDDDYKRVLDILLSERLKDVESHVEHIKSENLKKAYRRNVYDAYKERITDKDGKLTFATLDSYLDAVRRSEKLRQEPRADWQKMDDAALVEVQNKKLTDDFWEWVGNLFTDEEWPELLFNGWTPDGYRKYISNTLENASRIMNKQAKTNADDWNGWNATKAALLKKMRTLSDIRKMKDRLRTKEDYEKEISELSHGWDGIVSNLSGMQRLSDNKFFNSDYAENRLQEAILEKNPIKYLNEEYNYDIEKDSEFAKELEAAIKNMKEAPAKYFEAKFSRPVYLNEFKYAIVPDNIDDDIRKGLADAGLKLIKYTHSDSEDFESKVRQATGNDSDVRFRETPKNTSLDQVLFRISVYHNSPYLLKKADGQFIDPATGESLGFDTRFVGTGEGAIAHGWGSYFSVEDLKDYREPSITYYGQPVTGDPWSDLPAERAIYYEQQEGSKEKAVKFLRSLINDGGLDEDEIKDYQLTITALENDEAWGETNGHRYEVSIPDNTGDNYLEEMRTLPKPQRRRIAGAVRNLEGEPAKSVKFTNYKNGWESLAGMIEREPWAYLEIRDRLVQAFGGRAADEKRLSDLMSSIGFVGVHYNGNWDGECYVIFNDEDARIENHTAFREANLDQEIFVSNAQRAVEKIQQDKATPQQWLAMIQKQGGIKAGEDKWLRLSQWFQEQTAKTLTKQEVLDYIGENKIQIEEQRYGEMDAEEALRADIQESVGEGQSLEELQAEYEDILANADNEISELDGQIEVFEGQMHEKYGERWEEKMTSSEEYRYDDMTTRRNEWINEPSEAAFHEMMSRYGDDFEIGYFVNGQGYLDYNIDPFEADENASMIEGVRPLNSTRLEYTTDGLENKREIALTVPTIEPWGRGDQVHFGDAGEGRAIAWIRFGDASVERKASDEEISERISKMPKAEQWEKVDGSNFVVKKDVYYYPGTRNQVNHSFIVDEGDGTFEISGPMARRMFTIKFQSLEEAVNAFNTAWVKGRSNNTRQKVLVIDEIQSNRHQQGREQGYASQFNQSELDKAREEAHAYGEELYKKYGKPGEDFLEKATAEEKAHFEELNGRVSALVRLETNGIPDAPFEKNWAELAMKRMLRLAAEEGYEQMAWTNGETQADRYGLGSEVRNVYAAIDVDGNRVMLIRLVNGPTIDIRHDDQGNIISHNNAIGGLEQAKNISDLVGKDIAVDALTITGRGSANGREYGPEALRIGAEGMKAFYDKMLVNFMNKYGKQWGVSVHDEQFPDIFGIWHTIDVTPEMKRDVMEGQLMFREANSKNKQLGQQTLDDNITMFRISNRDRETISRWLEKRKDITPEERQKVLDYLDTFEDKKLQLAAGWWFVKGTVRFPEDMPKVEQAVQVASIAKVDPMKYSSPMELINAHADIKLKEKPIDPNTVRTLHKVKELPDGIVVYDVSDTEKSRENMRQIINTHFGKNSSPWCLLQGDEDGNLTEQSKEYWNYYNSYPKQVAFKDGKLLAFSANKGPRAWWDRTDNAHNGIPVEGKIPGDELGRSAVLEYDSLDGEVSVVGDMWKGSPENGPFETYYDTGELKSRSTRKNFEDVGLVEMWHKNGQKYQEYTNDETGRYDGLYLSWHDNGQMYHRQKYQEGYPIGLHEAWYDNGQLREKEIYPDDILNVPVVQRWTHVGPFEVWYENGNKKDYVPYNKEGLIDGTEAHWYEDGTKEAEIVRVQNVVRKLTHWYQNGGLDHIKEWDENERKTGTWEYYTWNWDKKTSVIRERMNFKNGFKDGVSEEFYTDGSIKNRQNFKGGLVDGLFESWEQGGKPFVREFWKDGRKIGREHYDYEANQVVQQFVAYYGPNNSFEHRYNRTFPLEGYTPLTEEELSTYPDWVKKEIKSLESPTLFREVTDPLLLEALEAGKKQTGYRTVAVNEDDSFGSPMASRLGKRGEQSKPTSSFRLGVWEEAEENPDMATDNGKVNLIKPGRRGSVGGVDYNPYIHIRPTSVNKQFTQAWARPELVYIETEYPERELTSGYKADKAKLPVGRHAWNGGELILSRWDKPMRIVPWEEVADQWEQEFKESGVTFDIVPPQMLDILAARGVDILAPKKAAGKAAMDAYKRWKNGRGPEDGGTRFRITPEMDAEYEQAYKDGDEKKAMQMVKDVFKVKYPNTVVTNRKGEPLMVYHGTYQEGFNVFAQPGENLQGLIWTSRTKKYAESYTGNSNEANETEEVNVPQKNGIYKLFVNIEKPLHIGYIEDFVGSETWDNLAKKLKLSPEELFKALEVKNKQDYDYYVNAGRGYSHFVKYKYPVFEFTRKSTFVELLKKNGYDGVVAREGGYGNVDKVTTFGAVSNNQVKSAEPFTFDDENNLIPLSKRFDDTNDNIRFREARVEEAMNTLFGNSQLSLFGNEEMNGGVDNSKRNSIFVPNNQNNERTESNLQREGNQTEPDNSGRAGDRLSPADVTGIESLIKPLRKLEPGETCYVERKFTEAGEFSFIGKEHIESEDDVAYIFRKLETKAVENAFLVFVKDGKPTILHVGMGGIHASSLDLTPITFMMQNIEPDEVYLVHNHPSGNLKSSPADKQLWKSMHKLIGSKLQLGIIIDTTRGEFGLFAGDDISTVKHNEESAGNTEIKTYRFDERVFSPDYKPNADKHWISSRDVAEFVAAHRLGKRDKISVLCLDYNFNILGNFFLPYTTFDSDKTIKKVAVDCAYYCGATGANAVFLYGNGMVPSGDNMDSLGIKKIQSFLEGQDMRLIDVIGCYREEDGGYYSYADHGRIASPAVEYRGAQPIGGKTEFREREPKDYQRIEDMLGTAAARYERAMDQMGKRMTEVMQDSLKSVDELQKAIADETGKPIRDFENAYWAAIQYSSRNKAMQEAYHKLFYRPLMNEVSKLVRGEDNVEDAMSDLNNYLVAKHGLERNEVFARRDARKEYEELKKKDPNTTVTEDGLYKIKRNRDYSGLIALTGRTDDYEAILKDKKENLEQIDEELRIGAITDEEYNKRKKRINKVARSEITKLVQDAEADAQLMVDNYEANHDTAELWKRINAATKETLRTSKMGGVLSEEKYQELTTMFEYYVPLRGFDETTSDDIYGYYGTVNSPYNTAIKKAYGRKSLADSPLATIANIADSEIMRANRNRIYMAALALAESHHTKLMSVSEVLFQRNQFTGEWEMALPQLEDSDTPEEVAEKMAAFRSWFAGQMMTDPMNYRTSSEMANVPYKVISKKALSEHQILATRGGKHYILTVNGNPRAAQALAGKTNPDSSPALQWLAPFNRFLASVFTQYNPSFVLANLSRDGIYTNAMVWAKESPIYAANYNKNWGKVLANMASLLRKYKKGTLDDNVPIERYFKEFIDNGGETGYTQLRSVKDYKKIMNRELKDITTLTPAAAGRKVMDVLGEAVENMNRWAEGVSRFAAYKTSREQGRSVVRSVEDAKEISVNFNKKGSGVAAMTDKDAESRLLMNIARASQLGRELFVFFNAGVQGIANAGGVVKNNPGKATALMLGLFLGGAALAMMNSGGAGDDDDKDSDYYNLPEYIRRSNICLKVGKHWITIPLPIELRALYGLGELAYSVASGNEYYENNELAYELASQLSQILPIDFLEGNQGTMAFIPSAVKPIVEAYWLNQDWTGSPIYNKTPYNENDPEWRKAYKSTSPALVSAARALSNATGGNVGRPGNINLNPARIEHLFEGYLGGVGSIINQAYKTAGMVNNEELREMRNVPVANRFIKDADDRAAVKAENSRFYKVRDYVEGIMNEERRLRQMVAEGLVSGWNYTEDNITKSQTELDELYESPEWQFAQEWRALNKGREKIRNAKSAEEGHQAVVEASKGLRGEAETVKDEGLSNKLKKDADNLEKAVSGESLDDILNQVTKMMNDIYKDFRKKKK